MPELPDILVYIDSLKSRLVGRRILRVRLFSPFVLRTVEPPLESVNGQTVIDVHRVGKRIVFELDNGVCLAIHLMVAGRFHWKPPGAKGPGKTGLAALDAEGGTLLLAESSTKKRASLMVLEKRALSNLDRGGIDVLSCTNEEFSRRLTAENHTLKRSLTDPRLFDGIGNAYSDEILHRARLSPFARSAFLTPEDRTRLLTSARNVLQEWIVRLKQQSGSEFPTHVTAFRPEMAVHGKFREPCPVCGTPVQRIVCAENECNYCPLCQTGGKVLADRSLSRLLKDDWPRSVDEL